MDHRHSLIRLQRFDGLHSCHSGVHTCIYVNVLASLQHKSNPSHLQAIQRVSPPVVVVVVFVVVVVVVIMCALEPCDFVPRDCFVTSAKNDM